MDCLAPTPVLLFRIAFLVSSVFFLNSCEESNAFPAKKNLAEDRLPYYNTPDFTASFSANDGTPHFISDFSFTDQDGNTVTQKSVEGKIHVADFFFTSCGSICPRMTHSMKTIADAFPGDSSLVLLSYSVTPWIDSVGRLREYAAKNNINSKQWHLLTGSKSKIYDLARRSYFAEEEPGFTKDSTEFLHTEHFLLVDKNKRIRGIYNGTLQTEMQQLIADIGVLEKEN